MHAVRGIRLVNVLIACEFSGIVRDAFAERGHFAISCDLLPSEKPGFHYQGLIESVLAPVVSLWAPLVGPRFDLMIAFPPCTYLAVSGARWFKGREREQEEALAFVQMLMDAPIPRIALENPVGVISTRIRKPDQYIQPWEYGHPETKKTGLWLQQPAVPIPLPLYRDSRKAVFPFLSRPAFEGNLSWPLHRTRRPHGPQW